MSTTVQKLFNANVYLDATLDLMGRASEITLPTLKPTTNEHSGLGMVGQLVLPAGGIEEQELQIKWSGFYQEHIKAAANPFQTNKLQIRGNLETHGAGGRLQQLAYVCKVTGWWKETPLGTLKPREAADGYDDKLTLNYLSLKAGGEELLEIDVYNNIWRSGGEDLLATYRQNLGQ